MPEPLRGKVAKILNSRELVINLGASDGVTNGMVFEVLDQKGEDIQDPDSGEVLGSIDRPKVEVRVSRTFDRLAIAETYKARKVNVGGGGGLAGLSEIDALTQQLMPPKWVTRYETFKTDEKTWEDVDEDDCYIKTGDAVRQLLVDSEVESR